MGNIPKRLSKEQYKLINLGKQGYNVLVDACIGSGKTTTIQALCNKLPKSKKILYLTYNRLLKLDAQKKIKNTNVKVQNYHGFGYLILNNAGIRVGISDIIQAFIKNEKRLNIPKYDVLIIDEYQDIEQELADMLVIIKKQNPNMQIIAVGDMKQKIYDKTNLDTYKFITEFLGDFELLSFTKCFRLSNNLASRLGQIWGKKIIGANKDCDVINMTVDDVTEFLAKQELSQILCLGSRYGTMSKVLNELERNYPYKFNKNTVYASITDEDRTNIKPDDSTAIFTTFDSSKGLERDICVIFDYTENYWYSRSKKSNVKYEIIRNIFCVAASRGKQKIIFVEGDNKALSDKTLATPTSENMKYKQPFLISEMFAFKHKEDVEECYKLLNIKELQTINHKIIGVKNNDRLIDLSPCIGILQEASFFQNYDIDQEILYSVRLHSDRPKLKLKEDASLEDKVLYLTAYETYYNRYVEQVKTPFVDEATLNKIHDRLGTIFNSKEEVQRECEIRIVTEKGQRIFINGRIDVLKNNIVYELKFVSDLSHEHFLQCAIYMMALGLEKGVVWNVKNNRMYEVTIPDRNKFMKCVIKTITKGCITKGKYSLPTILPSSFLLKTK